MFFKISLRQWGILIPLITALCMIMLDATVLPVALPTIQKELHVSPLVLQWIINSYLLVNASLVLAGGRLSDLLGRKEVFLAGLILFGVSSALGGLAWSGAYLIVSRALQGLGAALMAPSAFAIIMSTFPEKSRGKAVGFSVSISSVFLCLGPFIGGFFTEYLTWRWVFWINLLIGGIGLYFTAVFVPRVPTSRVKIDLVGFFLVVLTLFLLITGIMHGQELGFSSPYIWGSFVISGVAFILLIWQSNRVSDPFFDVSVFKNRVFFTGCSLIAIIQFILMNPVYWAIYFQEALGLPPFQAGSLTVISTFPVLFLPSIAGGLSDRLGARWPLVVGFVVVIASLIPLYVFFITDSFWFLLPGLLLFGVGTAMIMTPASTTAVGAIESDKRGVASGVFNTFRYTGASMGVAILGITILTTKQNTWDEFLRENSTFSPTEQVQLEKVYEHKEQLESPIGQTVKKLSNKSSQQALRYNVWISGGLSIVAVILTLVFIQAYKMEEDG